LVDGDILSAEYADAMPRSSAAAAAAAPSVRFVDPSPPPMASFSAAWDCAFQLLLVAADTQPDAYRLSGSSVRIYPTRYQLAGDVGGFRPGLAPGMSFSQQSASPANASVLVGWVPGRQDRGLSYQLCFAAADALGLVDQPSPGARERCVVVGVAKCQKCLARGESLDTLSRASGTDWRLLWSMNPDVRDPADIPEGRRINASLAYAASTGDSLASLATRFGTSVRVLLALNPDAAADAPLFPGTLVCVLPDPAAFDRCPPPRKSSTWEPLSEQYVPPDYYDNPYNWEAIQFSDPRGLPTKTINKNYPQRP
jgi:phage tail protein X